MSYRSLYRQAEEHAALLRAQGVRPGDRVAILLPNSITCLMWLFGTAQVGAILVIVNELLSQYQMSHVIRHSGARLVVTTHRWKIVLGDDVPADCRIIDAVPEDMDIPRGTAQRGTNEPPIGCHPAALIYTSGSTGPQKGVMVTHANLVAGARIVADYLRLTAEDRTLSVLPWSFDAGLNQVLATFWAGGTLVIAGSSYAPDLCRTLVSARITGLAGVPPLWEILVARPSSFLNVDLPRLRYVTNTGGVLRDGALAAVRRAHPHTDVYLMYGLTEAFRSTYLSPELIDVRPGSIGRAVPDTEILVLDSAGRRCAPGEVGELVHRGPTVAAGYWHDPAATAEVFRPFPFAEPGSVPEYVVHSGDYVRQDEDGYLYYVGRRDEQFKSRGFRVNPTEIEAGLLASGLVSQAVVFADQVGDDDPGIVAVIVPAEPATFEPDALAAHCRTVLPSYQLPTRFRVRTTLPHTPSGKLDRAAVKSAEGTVLNVG